MSEKYTIGFAGFGYMGSRLLEGFLNHRRVVTDPFDVVGFRLRPPTLKRIRKLYPDIVKADSYEALFEGRHLDDVVIASPTERHIPQTKYAIERGTDVFLEKPISTDLEETRAFVEYVLNHNSIVFIDYIEDALPISQVRDALLFGDLSPSYRLTPTSFVAVRTKDRESPNIEKNWRDFDAIAGRDSIHCLFKILKILYRTTGRSNERAILPASVQAQSRDLVHPDPAFSKQVSGEIVGELSFEDDITARVLTSALAVARRGFSVPSCFTLSEEEEEEAKLQRISCVDREGAPVTLMLNFIANTLDVSGLDPNALERYMTAQGFSPQKREVVIEGQPFQRYAFGDTEIETWVMRTYFGLKALKKQRSVQALNQDISLSTVTAGYYTQLWAALLQRSADEGGKRIAPEYVKEGHVDLVKPSE